MPAPNARAAGISLLVLAGLSAPVGCGKLKEIADPQVVTIQEHLALGPADFVVDAPAFGLEFKLNRRAAEDKYKGKVIEVRGTVSAATRDEADRGQIGLATGERLAIFPACACLFQDRNIAGKVGKGQTVRIKGRFVHYLFTPYLAGCEIVETGPETQLRVTAEQVAAEYTADTEACEEKYKDRTLILSATVAAVKTDENKVKFVELRGDGRSLVEVRYITLGGKWPAEYAAGDRVRMVAEMLSLGNGKGRFVVVLEAPLDD